MKRLILCLFLVLVSCDSSDQNIPDDITQFQWKLISMETSDKLFEPNLENYHNDRAHIKTVAR